VAEIYAETAFYMLLKGQNIFYFREATERATLDLRLSSWVPDWSRPLESDFTSPPAATSGISMYPEDTRYETLIDGKVVLFLKGNTLGDIFQVGNSLAWLQDDPEQKTALHYFLPEGDINAFWERISTWGYGNNEFPPKLLVGFESLTQEWASAIGFDLHDSAVNNNNRKSPSSKYKQVDCDHAQKWLRLMATSELAFQRPLLYMTIAYLYGENLNGDAKDVVTATRNHRFCMVLWRNKYDDVDINPSVLVPKSAQAGDVIVRIGRERARGLVLRRAPNLKTADLKIKNVPTYSFVGQCFFVPGLSHFGPFEDFILC